MTAQLTAEQIDDFQLAWGNAFGKNNDLFARLCALAKANLTAGKPATISMISDWGTDLKNLPAGSNRELVAWWEQAMRYHYQVVQAEYPRDAQQAEIKLRNHLGAIPVTIPPGYTVVKLKDLHAAPSLEDRRTHRAPPAHITAEIQPWEFTKDTLDKATADLFLKPAPPAEDALVEIAERIRSVADEIEPYCQEDFGPNELWNRLWGELRGIANDLEAKK